MKDLTKVIRELVEAQGPNIGQGKITLKNVIFHDIADKRFGVQKWAKKFNVKVTQTKGSGPNGEDLASISGQKKDIISFFLSDAYGYPDEDDIAEEYPELFK